MVERTWARYWSPLWCTHIFLFSKQYDCICKCFKSLILIKIAMMVFWMTLKHNFSARLMWKVCFLSCGHNTNSLCSASGSTILRWWHLQWTTPIIMHSRLLWCNYKSLPSPCCSHWTHSCFLGWRGYSWWYHFQPGIYLQYFSCEDTDWSLFSKFIYRLPGLERIQYGMDIVYDDDAPAPFSYFSYCGDTVQNIVQDVYRGAVYNLPDTVCLKGSQPRENFLISIL